MERKIFAVDGAGQELFELGRDLEMIGAQGHTEGREADILRMPAPLDDDGSGEARLAFFIGGEAIAGAGALPVLAIAEHQAHGLAGQRLVFDVGEFEIDIERHGLGAGENSGEEHKAAKELHVTASMA